ncbi:MAG: hypothetical protein RI909_520 [Bacteroidota bacterium]
MPGFSIYILYSAKAVKYYVGESEDVAARLKSHLFAISIFSSNQMIGSGLN